MYRLLPGLLIALGIAGAEPAAEPGKAPPKPTPAVSTTTGQPARPAKLTPLNKQGTVLLDLEGKRLLLKGRVCLRKGALELLCCLKQTKEHESIFSVDTKAYVVHTGLLALGAEQGRPVTYEPEFQPPAGQQIDVFVEWKDNKGTLQRLPGQELIRYVTHRFFVEKLARLPAEIKLNDRLDEMRYDAKNKELLWYGPMSDEVRDTYLAKTKDKAFRDCILKFHQRTQPRPMDAHWVFAGSSFYVDEETGEKSYRAEDGDLICVANFNSAMLDIASRSGNGADELLFEAWTERLPEVDTPVTIELIPVAPSKPKTASPSVPKSSQPPRRK